MRHWMLPILLLAVLASVMILSGCPKKEQAELQGAPTGPTAAPAPPPAATGEHVMPGGEKMAGSQHAHEGEGKPAADKTGAAGQDPDTASCIVLGTTMPKEKMIPYEYKGKTYYFCCPPCVDKFKADPEKYLKNPAKPKPAGEGM